jgi:hypothetical protein
MDYTPKYTFTAGTTATALEVAENMFEPHTTPTSPSVFNGWLDEDNRESAWDVTWEMVRQGAFSRPGHSNGTHGLTANLDYFSDLYQGEGVNGDWRLSLIAEAEKRAVIIPGCARSFEVPWQRNASAIYLHFTVTLIGIDSDFTHPGEAPGVATSQPTGETLLIPFVNGAPLRFWTRRVISSRLTLPDRLTTTAAFLQDFTQPEQRTYAFSCMFNPRMLSDLADFSSDNSPLVRGIHTADLRIAHVEDHFRVKTCHVTAIPIR